jgi:hypothetical protein
MTIAFFLNDHKPPTVWAAFYLSHARAVGSNFCYQAIALKILINQC